MRLAREPTTVPVPPAFTPTANGSHAGLEPRKTTVAGTLLISWLNPAEVKTRLTPSVGSESPALSNNAESSLKSMKMNAKVSTSAQSKLRRTSLSRIRNANRVSAIESSCLPVSPR